MRCAMPDASSTNPGATAANRQEYVSHPTRDEIEWERVAEFHLEHNEPNAARLAATVSDTLRFYRLHMEAKGNPGWQA